MMLVYIQRISEVIKRIKVYWFKVDLLGGILCYLVGNIWFIWWKIKKIIRFYYVL